MAKAHIRKPDAPLSADHERILLAATVIGESLNPYRAIDVRNFMGADARRDRTTTAIAQALRHLAALRHIQQIGPGLFRKLPVPANDIPAPVPVQSEASFRPLTREQLMAGRSHVRRKSVALEEPLWPEDAA